MRIYMLLTSRLRNAIDRALPRAIWAEGWSTRAIVREQLVLDARRRSQAAHTGHHIGSYMFLFRHAQELYDICNVLWSSLRNG